VLAAKTLIASLRLHTQKPDELCGIAGLIVFLRLRKVSISNGGDTRGYLKIINTKTAT
jgi:hypothetical protein